MPRASCRDVSCPLSYLKLLRGLLLSLLLDTCAAVFRQHCYLLCVLACDDFEHVSFASAAQVASTPHSLGLSLSSSCRVTFGTCWLCAASGPPAFGFVRARPLGHVRYGGFPP